jgi:hypothetical protein
VFVGLMGLLAMFGRSPDYIWFLQALSPVFQFGAGLVLLYIAWSLPRLLTSDPKTARALFIAVATLTMLHSFADWLFGFGLLSFGVTLGALVIVSYLYANFRRLSSEATTDLTSASSGIR